MSDSTAPCDGQADLATSEMAIVSIFADFLEERILPELWQASSTNADSSRRETKVNSHFRGKATSRGTTARTPKSGKRHSVAAVTSMCTLSESGELLVKS